MELTTLHRRKHCDARYEVSYEGCPGGGCRKACRFLQRTSVLLVLASALYTGISNIYADIRVYGQVQADKALVYFIQPRGPEQHLFADRQWLGVVRNNSYAFAKLDPGEYLIWSGKGGYDLAFLGSGKTYYFELDRRSIRLLPEVQGRSSLQTVGAYSKITSRDPETAREQLKTFDLVREQAVADDLYRSCRFSDDRLQEFQKRAASGNVDAHFELGTVYWLGECIERDGNIAIGWFRTASAAGDARASRVLGDIYRVGRDITKDETAAEKWYRLAAEQGDLVAQQRLAEIYRYGIGVEADATKAISWYRKAVEQHDDTWSKQQIRALQYEASLRLRDEQILGKDKAREIARHDQRVRERRTIAIHDRFGQLGIAVAPFDGPVRIEQPRKKKIEQSDQSRAGSSGGGGMEYMLPPEIMLGVLAVTMLYYAIDASAKRRLTDADKQTIQSAERVLRQAFDERSVQHGLDRHILDSGRLPDGHSLYLPVEYQGAALEANRYQHSNTNNSDVVVEIETTGIGLVLAEKRYRPTQFLMASEVRLIDTKDGAILEQASICYGSPRTPRFSAWAAGAGGRLRAEMESAYATVAEDIQRMLAGDKPWARAKEDDSCARLVAKAEEESITPIEPDGR